ncbi:MAG: hypothetical protein AAGI38_16625 [Bacteroidota bacterium]
MMERIKEKKLIPLWITVSVTLISIVVERVLAGAFSSIYLTAVAELGIIFLVLKVRTRYWMHAFAVLLLLGALGVLRVATFSLTIGILGLQLELVPLLLLIIHLAVNREVVKDFLLFFKQNDQTYKENRENQVKSFEKKFAAKKREELEKIVKENLLDPVAVEAARRLLKNHQEKDE